MSQDTVPTPPGASPRGERISRSPPGASSSAVFPPITRLTLALYCGASGDHNPLHVDSDFARAAGYPDVFAHGMLVMAYLGRLVDGLAPAHCLRRFSARFVAITRVGDQLTCFANRRAGNDAGRAIFDLLAVDQSGEVKVRGEAEIDVAEEAHNGQT